jgi:hypothetical protein
MVGVEAEVSFETSTLAQFALDVMHDSSSLAPDGKRGAHSRHASLFLP